MDRHAANSANIAEVVFRQASESIFLNPLTSNTNANQCMEYLDEYRA